MALPGGMRSTCDFAAAAPSRRPTASHYPGCSFSTPHRLTLSGLLRLDASPPHSLLPRTGKERAAFSFNPHPTPLPRTGKEPRLLAKLARKYSEEKKEERRLKAAAAAEGEGEEEEVEEAAPSAKPEL